MLTTNYAGTVNLNNSELDVTTQMDVAAGVIDGGGGAGFLNVANTNAPINVNWSGGALNNLRFNAGFDRPTGSPADTVNWSGGGR